MSPIPLHYEHVAVWKEHFPDAIAWASPGVLKRAKAHGIAVRFDRELNAGAIPEEWKRDLRQAVIRGALLDEFVLFHEASKTLIVTDTIQNFELDKIRQPYRALVWAARAYAPCTGAHRFAPHFPFQPKGDTRCGAGDALLATGPNHSQPRQVHRTRCTEGPCVRIPLRAASRRVQIVMLESLPDFPDHVIAVRASGKVTGREYRKVLLPVDRQKRCSRSSLNLFYQFAPEFTGMDARGMWEDTKLDLSHGAAGDELRSSPTIVRSVSAPGWRHGSCAGRCACLPTPRRPRPVRGCAQATGAPFDMPTVVCNHVLAIERSERRLSMRFPKQTEILIVGAGPSGLAFAAELARHRVPA